MVSALGTRALRVLALVVIVMGAGVAMAAPGIGQVAPEDLGDAEDFAVLAGTEITDAPGTGPPGSEITGDIGVYDGTSITGITCDSGQVSGDIYTMADDGEACTLADEGLLLDAKSDLTDVYVDISTEVATPAPLGPGLDSATFGPGVYDTTEGTFLLSGGTLTLEGDADAVFIFQALAESADALNVLAGSTVELAGGAQACNVWWAVYGATIGANVTFVGNILALTSITVGDATTIDGRLLAQNGTVTLINDTITVPVCEVVEGPGDGGNGDGGNGGGGNGGGGNGGGGNGGGANGTSGTPGDDTSGQAALTAGLTLASDAQSSDLVPTALLVQPNLLG